MNTGKYDFEGWVTKYNRRCTDGRTLVYPAFKDCDGAKVPMVWNHDHDNPSAVMGNMVLEHRDEGVWGYGSFNESDAGKQGKILVYHGDIVAMSIYANKLKENAGGYVRHGDIKEVSLVLAGANPEAYIRNVIRHGDWAEDESIIYTGVTDEGVIVHYDESEGSEIKESENVKMPNETLTHADTAAESGETVQDVIESMNDKQKKVLYALVALAQEEAGKSVAHSDEGDGTMQYNVFENNNTPGMDEPFLSHSEQKAILADVKRTGSLKASYEAYMKESGKDAVLAHADDYGVKDVDLLFPEAHALNNGAPEFIDNMPNAWVGKVMAGVKKLPWSRVKSMWADITEDEARAKGYIKGKYKKEEVFSLLKRRTEPTTVYKKQKMDRDDIVDIDFDVVSWIKGEMRMKLNEELARAFLLGDGRPVDSDDHINDQCIRPIVNEADLFTIRFGVDSTGTAEEVAQNFIDAAVKARIDYRGTGHTTLFTTEEFITDMLLLKDGIGHRLYKTEAELATAMRVSEIVPVPYLRGFEDKNGKVVMGIIVNMNDYSVGTDKGGEVSLFDDFDLNYNQQLWLMETRCSGALTKPFSAIVLLENDATESLAPDIHTAMDEFKRH